MARQVTPSQYSAERRGIRFDFLSQLRPGDTIISSVVTATVYSGVDATPQMIISGGTVVSGTIAEQAVTGGIPGVIYDLSCAAMTANSNTLVINTFLAILPGQP